MSSSTSFQWNILFWRKSKFEYNAPLIRFEGIWKSILHGHFTSRIIPSSISTPQNNRVVHIKRGIWIWMLLEYKQCDFFMEQFSSDWNCIFNSVSLKSFILYYGIYYIFMATAQINFIKVLYCIEIVALFSGSKISPIKSCLCNTNLNQDTNQNRFLNRLCSYLFLISQNVAHRVSRRGD